MLKVVVMVSGGGTNLQAILDAVQDGKITNTEIVGVISNKKDAYALTRAQQAGIPSVCVPTLSCLSVSLAPVRCLRNRSSARYLCISPLHRAFRVLLANSSLPVSTARRG